MADIKEKKYIVDNSTLMAEWNWEKNSELIPEHFLANSNKKVWWKCVKGHEWEARIADRNKGRNCPFCTGKRALKGYNDLQTVNPTLAEEWNYEKNGDLTPEHFTANSNKKVWWKCAKGHEWQATITHRTNGRGCPYCSGRYAIKGKNDLQTVNPTLAGEWNYEKNGDLTPEHFTANSSQKAWWKCSKGHEWQATIADRNKGKGCPYCSGRYAIKGENDLQTVNPTLAEEWNYEKNGDLTPKHFTANSNKKVWWKCSKGHEWKAVINSRSQGHGCPFCAKEKRKTIKD